MAHDFDTMNETDVREIVIRPFLHKLGYVHGTAANVRSEVPLTYGKSFLGRKKKNDPPLRGRADYVCDATSYGRWVIEAKHPGKPLDREDAQQAHTYAAHPEIAASHFLVTNGRDFRLYATSELDQPLLSWSFCEIDEKFLQVQNIIGFTAMKRRAGVLRVDAGKPLAAGQPSQVEVIAGEIVYGEHRSDHPLFQDLNAMTGLVGQITGGHVTRAEDGRLLADVKIRAPLQHLQPIITAMGNDRFEFLSSDKYVSTDREKPTIFQNSTRGRLEPGTLVPFMQGQQPFPLPFGFDAVVWVEAVGFLDGDYFRGIARFSMAYDLIPGEAHFPILRDLLETVRANPKATMHGEAEINFRVGPMPRP